MEGASYFGVAGNEHSECIAARRIWVGGQTLEAWPLRPFVRAHRARPWRSSVALNNSLSRTQIAAAWRLSRGGAIW